MSKIILGCVVTEVNTLLLWKDTQLLKGFFKERHNFLTGSFSRVWVKVQPLHTQWVRRQQNIMMNVQRFLLRVINYKESNNNIQANKGVFPCLQNVHHHFTVSHMDIFTIDLQIAAVFLCPACQDEVVTGFDLEVFSFILVLVGRKKKLKVT